MPSIDEIRPVYVVMTISQTVLSPSHERVGANSSRLTTCVICSEGGNYVVVISGTASVDDVNIGGLCSKDLPNEECQRGSVSLAGASARSAQFTGCVLYVVQSYVEPEPNLLARMRHGREDGRRKGVTRQGRIVDERKIWDNW